MNGKDTGIFSTVVTSKKENGKGKRLQSELHLYVVLFPEGKGKLTKYERVKVC